MGDGAAVRVEARRNRWSWNKTTETPATLAMRACGQETEVAPSSPARHCSRHR